MKHCRHCTDPDSPAHENPDFREAEENCAFYEDPEHQKPAGPARRRTVKPPADGPSQQARDAHNINVARRMDR